FAILKPAGCISAEIDDRPTLPPPCGAESYPEQVQTPPRLARAALQQRQHVFGHRRIEILKQLDPVIHRAHRPDQIVAEPRADQLQYLYIDLHGRGASRGGSRRCRLCSGRSAATPDGSKGLLRLYFTSNGPQEFGWAGGRNHLANRLYCKSDPTSSPEGRTAGTSMTDILSPPQAAPVVDPFGRAITYLRVSVTDRCDFRCVYCMSENMSFLPKADLLTLEELERLCGAFV